jgi:hypothetical protein
VFLRRQCLDASASRIARGGAALQGFPTTLQNSSRRSAAIPDDLGDPLHRGVPSASVSYTPPPGARGLARR